VSYSVHCRDCGCDYDAADLHDCPAVEQQRRATEASFGRTEGLVSPLAMQVAEERPKSSFYRAPARELRYVADPWCPDGTSYPEGNVVIVSPRDPRWLAQQKERAAEELPSVDDLARAMFETDPRVYDFVRTRAELGALREDASLADEFLLPDPEIAPRDEWYWQRRNRVLETAWTRNEGGLRSFWLERAAAVLDVLRRRR